MTTGDLSRFSINQMTVKQLSMPELVDACLELGVPGVGLWRAPVQSHGLEATAKIRQAEAGTGRHVPVIAMTAHAMKGDREKCLAAGMDGYVAKPIQAQELFAAIDGLVKQNA